MPPRRAALVAAMLAGILGFALLLLSLRSPRWRDPLAELPAAELRLAVAGKGLHTFSKRLAGFPRHAALLRAIASPRFRHRLGWPPGTPPPPDPFRSDDPLAVGFYEGGWCAARGDADGWGFGTGRGNLVIEASEPSRVGSAPGGRRRTQVAPPPDGALHLVADLRALVGGRSDRSARGWLSDWLPTDVDGVIEVRSDSVLDRWCFGGVSPSVLDLLDARPARGVLSQGWNTLPDDASTVAWFRLDPDRVRHAPGSGAASLLGERVDAFERFLGIALREEFASAIAGPGVASLRGPGSDGSPHVLLALDLARPEAARRVLDRMLVLGVLARQFRISTYRGVTIGAATLSEENRRIEPAAAIDGDLFLVASHRADLEDAIDRRREPAAEARAARLRARLDGLPAGSWKASSASRFVADGWSRMLEIPPAGDDRAPRVEAVLRREGALWILEGRGDAPAWEAEPLLPAIRWALRG